jgi:hypothetical protein
MSIFVINHNLSTIASAAGSRLARDKNRFRKYFGCLANSRQAPAAVCIFRNQLDVANL